MKHFRLLTILPILFLIFASCKTNEAPTNSGGNSDAMISTTIAGVVNDENGLPVSDADVTVSMNGVVKNSVKTNKFGTFMIKDVSVPSSRCFIICKKNGYFTGSRAEVPNAGRITEMRLTLQSNVATHTVNASSGGKITVGAASINFPSNAFVTNSGTTYTGTVNISAKFLDPTAQSFYNSFSGDMTGFRTDGSQTELLSYGVLRVQIKDGSGNELKLAIGKKATLSYPLAASMENDAPASMPLWYFDEVLGMWKEEGVAMKNGNSYTGEVEHFSDWNCDDSMKSGTIKGRVVCDGSEGIAGVYVTVGQRKMITDSSGYFSGRVPVNINFIISIKLTENNGLTADNSPVTSLTTGEVRTHTDIPLSICPPVVRGTIVDCSSIPTAGSVAVLFNGKFNYYFTTTGRFKLRVPLNTACLVESTTFDGKAGSPASVQILNSGDDFNIGNIVACDNDSSKAFYDIHYESDNDCKDAILSPDGSLVVLSLSKSNDVYDVKTGTKLLSLDKRNLCVPTFSADGTKLLTCYSKDSICVVNPRTGEFIQKFYSYYGNGIISPDGLSIVSTVLDTFGYFRKFGVFSVATGLKLKELSTSDTLIFYRLAGFSDENNIVFSHDGSPRKIVTLDIKTDMKVGDINISNVQFFNSTDYPFQGYSPNRTVAGFIGDYTGFGQINFFNTKTGTKINSSPFIIQDFLIGGITLCAPLEVSNENSFVLQKEQIVKNKDTIYFAPSIFGIDDGKLQKVLAIQYPITPFLKFKYSDDSRYLVGVPKNTIANQANYVRVWKVK